MRAEQVTDPVAYHGEGPVWSPRWGGLRWVDMLAGDILSLGAGQTVHRRHVGSVAAALRPRRSGGAVIGVERGFALEDPDGALTYLGELWTDDQVRMNEGGCDPDGRFYCGSMAYDRRRGAGALYRLAPDGSVSVVLREVTACTFGGPYLDQLFITTSREGLDPGEEPLAGSLFRAAAGVAGLPAREFAG